MANDTQQGMSTGVKLLIGCAAFLFLCLLAFGGCIVWLASGPESGVRVAAEMHPYATEYLAKHKILEDDETLIAYYDGTISMDGTDASILTDRRVIRHTGGATTSLPLRDVKEVIRQDGDFGSDVFLLESRTGDLLRIEIDPLNGGDEWGFLMDRAIERARENLPDSTEAPASEESPAEAGE